MTVEEVPLELLFSAREQLVAEIQERAREEGAKRFLTSFHELEHDWKAAGLADGIGQLPAVRWKLLNLEHLRTSNREKFDEQLTTLAGFLNRSISQGG